MTRSSISVAEAVAAVRGATWIQPDPDRAVCGHPGCTVHPLERQRIHTVTSNGLGADWDLERAETFIASSTRREWIDNVFGHDLRVTAPDFYVICFQVARPGDRR